MKYISDKELIFSFDKPGQEKRIANSYSLW